MVGATSCDDAEAVLAVQYTSPDDANCAFGKRKPHCTTNNMAYNCGAVNKPNASSRIATPTSSSKERARSSTRLPSARTPSAARAPSPAPLETPTSTACQPSDTASNTTVRIKGSPAPEPARTKGRRHRRSAIDFGDRLGHLQREGVELLRRLSIHRLQLRQDAARREMRSRRRHGHHGPLRLPGRGNASRRPRASTCARATP